MRIGQIKYIGKESNSLEDVEAGLIHSAENVYTVYPDPHDATSGLAKCGLSPRMLRDTLVGRSRPYRKNQERLAAIVRKLGAT